MFAMMGYPTRVEGPSIQKLFNDLDRNHDGGVSKEEIFVLFKKLLSI
jgi:Ca2+-binding EF-hand superfamily protein